jgi:hypothetical protein
MFSVKISSPSFCKSKAKGNCEARNKVVHIQISYVLQKTLGIHYNNLGSYKELLHFIEAKAWRVNEFIILTIHLAEVEDTPTPMALLSELEDCGNVSIPSTSSISYLSAPFN